MVTSGVGKGRLVCYMLVMSWITPLGVAIGIIVTYQGARQDSPNQVKLPVDLHSLESLYCVTPNNESVQILAVAVLQGLAAGTLLYITFYEVRDVDLPGYSHIFVSLTGTG